MSRKFYRRQFLNTEDAEGIALIEAHVSVPPKDTYISAEFKIADCNRVVTLDFGVWNQSDATNIRAKLRKMRLAFRAFELCLLEEIDRKKFT